MARRIVLTGGGTAGHVNPNIALLPGLKDLGFEIFYIGSHNGIERRLISECQIPYSPISTGKLRRYVDPKNITDIFRVVKGVGEAGKILKKIGPNIIFSKGGFVSVPVVLAARRLHIPVIIHESDSTPGLANKISFPFSTKICASFPETIKLLPEEKAVLTGTPIRSQLLKGDATKGREFCGFKSDKPIISVMGGSIGAVQINIVVRKSLKTLLKEYNIIHLCGKGNLDPDLNDVEDYAQFEYVGAELPDVFAATDLIVSRSGANAIFEILALKKPNILIPLPAKSSRGDQILNANSFADSGYSYVLRQEDLSTETLLASIKNVLDKKDTYVSKMEESRQLDAVSRILSLIEEFA